MGNRRLLSLDVLRGAAVAGMILVSAPGNDAPYGWLRHSAWNGFTPADLVFPLFLFALGVSAAVSLERHLRLGAPRRALVVQSAGRAALLFILGIAGNGVPCGFAPDGWRVMGVLQRIALCSFGAAALYLGTEAAVQAALGASLLAGYWAALTLIPVPGYGAGNLTAAGNLASWLDRLLLPGVLLGGNFDSEGLLSTIPAFATTIAGLLAGRFLLGEKRPARGAAALFGAGVLLTAAGLAWNPFFPINKHLWTSSFSLFSTGLALLLFGALHWLIEARQVRAWSRPLEAYGRNAFMIYALSFLFLAVQDSIPMMAGGSPGNLRSWLCATLFGWASPPNACLLYTLSYTALWLPLAAWLNRRGIALRVSWSTVTETLGRVRARK